MACAANAHRSNDTPEAASTILARIAVDDQSAVEECIDKYGTLVWQIIRRSINNKEDAEDIVQEVFIDIWKNAARFDATKACERTFVALIARRRTIDRLRKTYRQPPAMPYESNWQTLGDDAHLALDRMTDVQPVLKILNKLSASQQQMLVLSLIEGMSHGEIAAAVRLPIGTVKTHISRGLKKLRFLMGIMNTCQKES